MNTKQIDYCIELSQTLNFSKAADNKFVSQPSFSYQIKLLEEEIGFSIFYRNGKGVTLTPAGNQFVTHLRRIRQELSNAIEQGQNFSDKYKQSISIGLVNRESLYFLPDAIREMGKIHPSVQVIPKFYEAGNIDAFLKKEVDILFSLKEETQQLANSNIYPLFNSRIYLITRNDDVLASKKLITDNDLIGRTLMIGGGSPYALRLLQQQLIFSKELHLNYFNSPDHDSTLTNIAAGKGICLAPGFLNDHSQLFSWIPFDRQEHFECVLCTHKDDNRPEVKEFLKILSQYYANLKNFPL